MKKIHFIVLLTIMLIFNACSPKLGESFYKTPSEVIFQQWGNYLPNGWKAGMMSDNYPGVLAVVNEELIFDAQGPGSKPWMIILSSFKIKKGEINNIEISEELAFGRKIITISTNVTSYQFYLKDADNIYRLLTKWQKE